MKSMNSQTGVSKKGSVLRSSELEDLQVAGGREGNEDDSGESSFTFDTEWLDLSRSVIEEKETKIMARALESNRVVNLKVLFLHKNAGDVGARAMLNALTLGYLRGLEKLILWDVSSYDQITTAEEGTDTIADALAKGKIPDLHTLDLTGTLPKLIAPRNWSRVFGDLANLSSGSGRLNKFKDSCFGCLCLKSNSGRNQTLDCLRCQFFKVRVYSGDDGVRKIVRALRKHPLKALKFLNLGENYIGDRGVKALARLLADGKLPVLEELDLQNNRIGRKGAEKIVAAFLENPLLVARVKMDWPNLLLKERASAFRECNIRLEHRLAELKIKIEHDGLSDSFQWSPEYYLQRPPSHIKGYKQPHRLYMQCQAPGHSEMFHGDDAPPQGEGIQIRRRSCFGGSSRKFVARELREDKSAEEAEPQARVDSSTSRRIPTPSSDSKRGHAKNGQGAAGPSAYQSLPVTASSSSNRGSTVNIQDSAPFQAAPTPNSSANRGSAQSSGRSSSRAYLEDEKSLTRHKGVNHIYITAGSCGFIGAAKALGVRTEKGVWRECYSFARKTLQNQAETQEHIDSIMEELLMLADRKPHEFHDMFNLRRVLLRDRELVYYPAYVCSNCLSRLEAKGDYIKPIIGKTLLEVHSVSRGQAQASPSSTPSVRKYRKHFPKYDRQPSRLG